MESMSMGTEQEVEVEKIYQSSLARGKLRDRVWELVKERVERKEMEEAIEEIVLIAARIYGDHGVNMDDICAIAAGAHPYILSGEFDRRVRAVK